MGRRSRRRELSPRGAARPSPEPEPVPLSFGDRQRRRPAIRCPHHPVFSGRAMRTTAKVRRNAYAPGRIRAGLGEYRSRSVATGRTRPHPARLPSSVSQIPAPVLADGLWLFAGHLAGLHPRWRVTLFLGAGGRKWQRPRIPGSRRKGAGSSSSRREDAVLDPSGALVFQPSVKESGMIRRLQLAALALALTPSQSQRWISAGSGDITRCPNRLRMARSIRRARHSVL